MTEFKHWKLETDNDGIVWCHLDKQGVSANVLSTDVLDEFGEIVTTLEQDLPRGVVILSDKTSGFIAGADVSEFTGIENREQALAVMHKVHNLFNRFEALSCPTLCLINGFCLGGGMELALACRYRVALDDPGTRIGLPEILLGIHPGFGGSMRFIRLVGALPALQLMLAGHSLDAGKAGKLGLVDRVVPLRQFHNAARSMILQPPPRRRPPFIQRLADLPIVRPLLAGILRRELKKRVKQEQYPAPYALLQLWRNFGGRPELMLDREADSVANLITSTTSRNLVRVFMLQERLKSAGKSLEFTPRRVHVVGAGVMGGDIAAWCVLKGLTVTLQDRAPEYIAPAIKRAHSLFKKRLKSRHLVTAAMDRLVPDIKGYGIAGADVIIEAIVEDLDAKAGLFRELEQRAAADAILATNTSSIPLDEISQHLKMPERLTGIHFFNPVARMQLVEVVHSDRTLSEWSDKAAAFCHRIDRLPVQVRSSPGFLVNRVLTPYLLEASSLVEEGVAAETIDAAAVKFGMPMGPVELADTVGLDVCLHVTENLTGQIAVNVPDILRKLVADGHLGRKSGRGFYRYRQGKPVKSSTAANADDVPDLEDRLILRIVNECIACLREQLVADADLVDAAMVFGTGFAPFLGGPMNYAKTLGRDEMLERLLALEVQYGERFKPDAGWQSEFTD